MKQIALVFIAFFSVSLVNLLAQQQQEVVIIGTMHTVPGIVSKAYRPMLKNAIKYQPQDIYVERQPSWDTVSVKNYFPEFYAKADSLSRAISFDMVVIDALLEKPTVHLSQEEANTLKLYFYANLDFANMEFYRRVARYGVEGYDKPSRNENGDLTYPLAIAMDIKNIKSMDNQTYYTEYGKTWRACDAEGKKDGEYKLLEKALRKFWWRDHTGILGLSGLGRIANKPKNTALSHSVNSMEYRDTNCDVCDEANYYWDYRNEQMVKNTAEQILASGNIRNVVVVGAGHVEGMIDALVQNYPQLKVIRYLDMPDNRGKVDPSDKVPATVMTSKR